MNIDRLAEEYVRATVHVKDATEHKEELKKLLLKTIEESGEHDEKGNQWVAGEEYLIKRERRVSKGWDANLAEEWAKGLGILDNLTTTVTTTAIDPDKVAAYAFTHPELEATVKAFNTESVTWAFPQPVKQKRYEY